MKWDKEKEVVDENICGDGEKVVEGIVREEMRKYVCYLYEKRGSLVDYRWEDRIMIVDEMRRIEEMEEEVEEEEGDWRISVVEEGNILDDVG
ncbi:hypothetical protein, partial [Bacillus altitudinis]|uniref:hypothetical protein n=1 Tax=Bacillus altitudinis TaxID=293387 RepID=UPI00119E9AD6